LLGPSGQVVLDWYVRNNLVVNGALVLLGVVILFTPSQTRKIQNKIHSFWEKTPFVLTPGDRIAIEKAHARVGKKKGK
jgi:hypothetical protein